MVEAPRIRITYEKIRHTKNHRIVSISGPSYKRMNVDLIDYIIRKWWFAGKYIYLMLISSNKPTYVIRTHMMMYGRILMGNQDSPIKRAFMIIQLDNDIVLRWYRSQITLLDPNCLAEIKTNYTICTARQAIMDSIKLMKYDLSNNRFDYNLFQSHLKNGINIHSSEIITDFLLDQEYFPGVGNILQQEALYDCKILPLKKVQDIDEPMFDCLCNSLKKIIDLLYESYKFRESGKEFGPILRIYRKSLCPLGHKTIRKKIGLRNRMTTWCPVCQL